jgi:hypothetical protein
MILAVVQDGPSATAVAARVEQLVATYAAKDLKGFVLVVGGSPEKLRRMAHEQRLERAALCYPEPGHEDSDLRRKLKVNPTAQNTILVYRRFRVTANFVNVDPRAFTDVEAAVKRALP